MQGIVQVVTCQPILASVCWSHHTRLKATGTRVRMLCLSSCSCSGRAPKKFHMLNYKYYCSPMQPSSANLSSKHMAELDNHTYTYSYILSQWPPSAHCVAHPSPRCSCWMWFQQDPLQTRTFLYPLKHRITFAVWSAAGLFMWWTTHYSCWVTTHHCTCKLASHGSFYLYKLLHIESIKSAVNLFYLFILFILQVQTVSRKPYEHFQFIWAALYLMSLYSVCSICYEPQSMFRWNISMQQVIIIYSF